MDLRQLNNTQLHQKMCSVAQTERAALAEAIVCIHEIDRRQMYFDHGCPSLFDYLTKKCGYTNGPAQRRLDAARLMNNVPAISESIKSGEMTLEKVTHVQKALRQLQKEKRPITREQTQDLVSNLLGLSENESQFKVASTLDLKIVDAPKITFQADNSVRLEMTLTQEQWELLNRAKEVLSHQVPDGQWPGLVARMSELAIRSHREVKVLAKKSVQSPTHLKNSNSFGVKSASPSVLPGTSFTAAPAVNKTLTPRTRKIVLNNDQCCSFINPLTLERCGSRWQLQVDHRHSRWAGGSHEVQNLQALCRKHNNYKYKKENGIRPM